MVEQLAGILQVPEIHSTDVSLYSGDYEKEFRELESIYKYTPESYTTITPELKLQQLSDLNEKGCKVYWRTNNPVTEVKERK